MPVESASYISDLVSANPLTTDQVAQGDDHLRLIKAVLQRTFPNLNGSVPGTPNDLTYGVLPIGSIILWSGTLANIPTGWSICDGSVANGHATPDLRSRFVIGAGNGGIYNSPGVTGGSSTTAGAATTSSDGSHTHPGSTTNSVANHSHIGSSASSSGSVAGAHLHAGSTSDTAANHTHTASGTTSSDGSHNHGGAVDSHALSLSEIPAHNHLTAGLQVVGNTPGGLNLVTGSGVTWGFTLETNQGGGLGHNHTLGFDGGHTHTTSGSTSADGSHSHALNMLTDGDHSHSISTSVTVAADGAHSHTVTNPSDGAHTHTVTPPFYALAYIMRTL